MYLFVYVFRYVCVSLSFDSCRYFVRSLASSLFVISLLRTLFVSLCVSLFMYIVFRYLFS